MCHIFELLSCGTAYPQAPVSSIGSACDGRVSVLREPSSHGSTGKCRPAAASTGPAHAPSAAATALSISELTLDLAPARVKEHCTPVAKAPQPPLKSLGRTPGCPADKVAAALPPIAADDEHEARRRRLVLARLLLSRGKAAEALAHLEEGGLGVQNGLARQPCDADAACLRGRCMAALGNSAEARTPSPCLGAGYLGKFQLESKVLPVGNRRAIMSTCLLASHPT